MPFINSIYKILIYRIEFKYYIIFIIFLYKIKVKLAFIIISLYYYYLFDHCTCYIITALITLAAPTPCTNPLIMKH